MLFWFCWVFVAARSLSLVSVSGLLIVVSSLVTECGLWSTGLGEAWGLSYSEACGIFPEQNLCPLHWQADSEPLECQGSPVVCYD